MSEWAMSGDPSAPARSRRKWLIVSAVGFAMIIIAMIVVALVLVDKPHFGWLVGSMFAQIISSGVIAGSIVLLAGAWNLPERKSWRGWVLIVWALIGLTSPAFGFLFLAPWGVMVLALPVIVWIFITLFRDQPPA
jgi:MFS family permease